ncbi:signal peptidase I [Patescibacteria group bacterium]|nr:signal peptidase I [Patescibacteria group bacterium]MBU1921971.1 signal peptidase I [Patescibacteria group bacterium]
MSLFGRNKKAEEIKEKGTAAVMIGFVFEIIQVVVISLAIIIPIRYFLIQPFYVNGASMEPNFYDHEYLIIDEISYRFSEPERGDIIVFRYPNDPKQYFIKRIVGLPDETIEVRDGNVVVYNQDSPDGIIIEEKYLEQDQTLGSKKVKLRSDEYFVLGDNRSSSLDSRTFGPVNQDYIVGKVWLRGWPVTKIKMFQSPEYDI